MPAYKFVPMLEHLMGQPAPTLLQLREYYNGHGGAVHDPIVEYLEPFFPPPTTTNVAFGGFVVRDGKAYDVQVNEGKVKDDAEEKFLEETDEETDPRFCLEAVLEAGVFLFRVESISKATPWYFSPIHIDYFDGPDCVKQALKEDDLCAVIPGPEPRWVSETVAATYVRYVELIMIIAQFELMPGRVLPQHRHLVNESKFMLCLQKMQKRKRNKASRAAGKEGACARDAAVRSDVELEMQGHLARVRAREEEEALASRVEEEERRRAVAVSRVVAAQRAVQEAAARSAAAAPVTPPKSCKKDKVEGRRGRRAATKQPTVDALAHVADKSAVYQAGVHRDNARRQLEEAEDRAAAARKALDAHRSAEAKRVSALQAVKQQGAPSTRTLGDFLV